MGKLIAAVKKGDALKVMELVTNGAIINETDKEGCTPLHCATIGGIKIDVVRILVDNEANVNEKDNNGRTPLHYEVSSKNRLSTRLCGRRRRILPRDRARSYNFSSKNRLRPTATSKSRRDGAS